MDHPVAEAVRSLHPEFAAKLTPDQWAKLIQAIEQMLPIIFNLFNPPTAPV